jgi:RIO-like serine/threonine protein kinase
MKHFDLKILKTLKKDIFGSIFLSEIDGQTVVCRNYSDAGLWIRWLAHFLARREAHILKILQPLACHDMRVPKLIYFGNGVCVRSYIEGNSLYHVKTPGVKFYNDAMDILQKIHALGVVHNDLEKAANWIVTKDNGAAIIDFQLAFFSAKRGRLFQIARQEDVRHLIKNKNFFCSEPLSQQEMAILQKRSKISHYWRKYYKPVYNFATRKVLKYSDRDNSKYSR